MGDGEEDGDTLVRQEGASRVVVGNYGGGCLSVAGAVLMRGRAVTWKQAYISCGTGCRSTKSLRLKPCRNIR